MSEVVLLPNNDGSQQVEGLCQRLYYYQIMTQSTSRRIMSEVVLLPNTDRSQQVEGLCQRLYTTTVKGFLVFTCFID